MTAWMRTTARPGGAGAAILLGGLIAAVLDITTAFLNSGMHGGNPVRLLQGIAFALIGAEAFKGGIGTAALGLACHFFIAFSAAAVYWFASRRIGVMVREPVVSGLLYGVPLYLVMNFIVIPVSKIGHVMPNPPTQVIEGLLVLMICVGLPIALITRRYSR